MSLVLTSLVNFSINFLGQLMNITILANKDIASNYALNILLPKLSEHKICVFLSSRVGIQSVQPASLARLQFFEQELVNELIFPLLNSSNKTNFKSFEQLNKLLCQPIEPLNNINSTEGVAKIRASKPDLMLTIRYGIILKDAILNIPPLGILNLHSGLLPNYRGVMATFWAMLEQQQIIGTSLHYIRDSSIDTGDIIAKSELLVNSSKCYLWHLLQLYVDGCKLVHNTIQLIDAGETIKTSPQIGNGKYFTFPKEADLQKFHQLGLSLVNEQTVIEFINQHYY